MQLRLTYLLRARRCQTCWAVARDDKETRLDLLRQYVERGLRVVRIERVRKGKRARR